MGLIKKFFLPAIIVAIPLFFFYKTIFFGLVPFPGDLLVGNYEPYRSEIKDMPHKGQGADVVRQIYPWKYFSIDSIKNGELPLWNPYSFSGNPHLANLQSGVFYPVNILFLILPFIEAWTIYILLQYIFALTFTYLYLREIGLKKISSLFGGIAFSFCAFFTVWGEYGNVGHSLSFLPLIFFSTEKFLKQQTWYWYLLLILSFSFSIFAGYIQLTIYMIFLFLFYVILQYNPGKKNIKLYFFLLIAPVFSIAFSAVQIFPLYQLFNQSARGMFTYGELLEKLLPIQSLVTILVPDFFGNPATDNYFLQGGSSLERASNLGVWPLALAIFALFNKHKFYKLFFAISAALFYFLSLSVPPVAFIHSIGIPFLSTGVPTRMLAIFAFSISVLAALGMDTFLSYEKKKTLTKIIILMLGVFIALWIFTFIVRDPNLLIARRNLILPSGVFIIGVFLLILSIPKKITASLIILLTIFELFYAFQKFNSFTQKSFIYPDTKLTKEIRNIQGIDRIWAYGSAYVQPNTHIIEKIYTTDGYDPLFIKRYAEFVSASKNGKVEEKLGRTIAEVHGGYGVNTLKKNHYRKRALDLLGVKYVLNKNTTLDSAFDNFKLKWQEEDWQIYENPNVLPRIKLFGEYIILNDKDKIIKTLYDRKFDIHNTLILEKTPVGYKIKKDPESRVKVISYRPNKIEVETSSKTDQILFISDNYFPGWKSKVDNNDSVIYRANYTFRAIPIKAGKHNVEVYYSPLSFWIGFWVSVFTMICLTLLFVFYYKKRNVKKS